MDDKVEFYNPYLYTNNQTKGIPNMKLLDSLQQRTIGRLLQPAGEINNEREMYRLRIPHFCWCKPIWLCIGVSKKDM